jgi:hypothetical protein
MVDLKKCKIMVSLPLVFSSFGWSRVEIYYKSLRDHGISCAENVQNLSCVRSNDLKDD